MADTSTIFCLMFERDGRKQIQASIEDQRVRKRAERKKGYNVVISFEEVNCSFP